jgi:hypothetical protein
MKIMTVKAMTTIRLKITTKGQLLHGLGLKKVSTIGLITPYKTKTLITDLSQRLTGTTWMMTGTKKGILVTILMEEAIKVKTKVDTTHRWRAEDLQQVPTNGTTIEALVVHKTSH